MSRTFTHKIDESTLTTLCPRCLNAFRNARGIRVRRADPGQTVKEPCTYCQTNFGYDYYIQPPVQDVLREGHGQQMQSQRQSA